MGRTISEDREVWLSWDVSVEDYDEMVRKQDRDGIANFIHQRFLERYVTPLEAVPPGKENGFLEMASCCLLIEALATFRAGVKQTEDCGKAFSDFFADHDYFAGFRGTDFYTGVRCGILHRGETDKGWRIHFRHCDGPLLESGIKRINGRKFLDGMKLALAQYRKDLNDSNWNSEIWVHLRKKMNFTLKNSRAQGAPQ